MILEQKSSHTLMKSNGSTKLESSTKTPGSSKTIYRNEQEVAKAIHFGKEDKDYK